jgi:hypothetical protein
VKILFTGLNPGLRPGSREYTGFGKAAISLGYKVCSDLAENPDLIICVDYHSRYCGFIRRAKKLSIPLVLIKQEPPAVVPEHRKDNPLNLFDLVITRGSSSNVPIFNIGTKWDLHSSMDSPRLKRVIAITADKWSFVASELYSLRREMYTRDSRIDLFGHGWDEPNWKRLIRLVKEMLIVLRAGLVPKISNVLLAFKRPLNYLGPIDQKSQVLAKYAVSLVIENDACSMSEKIIDCILSGAIPVYVGPDATSFNIPRDLYVQSEGNRESIIKAIDHALSINSEDYEKRAHAWASLQGSNELWSSDAVCRTILRHIVGSFTREV